MRTLGVLLLVSLAGCGEDTVATLDDPALDGAVDSTSVDTAEPMDTTTEDATTLDTAMPDTAMSTDTAKADTARDDAPLPEVGGTFGCASETCSTTLQFCRRATSPGICPAPDSGVCPAGCPGCPALSLRCETMPMKCWAKPSCSCILIEVCGSPAAGTCMEKDGGFVAGCNGV
jgi:hypothetical protein